MFLSKDGDDIGNKISESLLGYSTYMWPGYISSKHHIKIAKALEQVERGGISRLIITMPPRAGKTMLVSEYFPAWYLGRNPDHQIIAATYSHDKAGDTGRKIRNQLQDPDFHAVFPGCGLSPDSKGANKLSTQQGGMCVSVGIGGAITGRGAHLFLIDDPIKSREEADSDRIRERLINWYKGVVYTRLMGKNAIIIIMCLVGDTPILMADNSWKPLKNIQIGDSVLTYVNGKHVSRRVTQKKCQGKDDIFKVSIRNHSVTGNKRHPFLVKKNETFAWVKLDDLKKGDEIVVSRLNINTGATITLEESWLLGFMYGDGWITINNKTNYNNGIPYKTKSFVTCIAKGDKPKVIKKYLYLMKKLFNVTPKDTGYGYYRTEVANIGKWFLSHGLIGKAKTKRLPTFIFSESIDIRDAFLNGYVTADGWIGRCGKVGKERMYFCSCNYDLLQDVRTLARSCGYSPSNLSVYRYRKKAPNSPKEIDAVNVNFSMKLKKVTEQFITEKVIKVESVGRRNVYDIQIDGSENFIADGVVVHNTRWHFYDLVGYLLEKEAEEEGAVREKWTVLDLPAIANSDDDLLERKIGESIWPGYKIFDLDRLEETKRVIGTREWNSQYQQQPIPDEGGMVQLDWFKRYKYRDKSLKIRKIVCSWDTAFKEKQLNDPSCCTIWAVVGNDFYLMDVINKHMDYPKLKKMAIDVHQRYNSMTGATVPLLIEDAASGQSLIQELKQDTQLPIIAVKPELNKQTRLSEVTALIEAGRVYLPDDAYWLTDYETQLCRFPFDKHDDMVDSTSQFLRWAGKPKFKRRRGKNLFWK